MAHLEGTVCVCVCVCVCMFVCVNAGICVCVCVCDACICVCVRAHIKFFCCFFFVHKCLNKIFSTSFHRY